MLCLAALLLPACGDKSTDTAGEGSGSDGPVDADGDGHEAGPDCDDTNPDVFPGATEVCNGIDDNCDAQTDEGVVTRWYADTDGDGYGDPNYATDGCDQPENAAANGDDCNDSDADQNPDARERCNDEDDDCDGSIDEDPLDPSSWYSDGDEDGYGDPDSEVQACDQPSGTVDNPDDCDDTRDDVNPGLVEVCGDGLDNDCDGGWSGCELGGQIPLQDAQAKIMGDGGWRAGMTLASAGDQDGDGRDEFLVGSHGLDPDGGENHDDGLQAMMSGTASGETYLATATVHARFIGDDTYGGVGGVPPVSADLNDDGWSDVVLGAPGAFGGLATGSVFVALGPTSGDLLLADMGNRYSGAGLGDGLGSALAVLDIDGDDVVDVLASDRGGHDAWVLLGPVTWGGSVSDRGTALTDGAGVLAGGDLDGDGLDEVVIGVADDDTNWRDEGAVYIVRGDDYAGADLAVPEDADLTLLGGTPYWGLGRSLAALEDHDGDGQADLLVGATDDYAVGPNKDGTAYVFLGPVSAGTTLADAQATITGAGADDLLGWSVANAGDHDVDGSTDLLVGGPGADTAWLFYGPVTGTLASGDADAWFTGQSSGDQAGFAVASAGDINGDTVPDVLIGGTGDTTEGTDSGAAWLIWGGGP